MNTTKALIWGCVIGFVVHGLVADLLTAPNPPQKPDAKAAERNDHGGSLSRRWEVEVDVTAGKYFVKSVSRTEHQR
jgi:hypothetical protein